MTGPLSHRRRAEEFDAALSRPLTEQDAQKFVALLALVHDLRSIPDPMPRPEFVSGLRSRLMAEADTALVPQTQRPLTAEEQRLVLPVRPHRRDRRLAIALGGAALLGATTSMAVAAQTALPGESLYPVKRALEDAQTGIARGDTAKGRALLGHANDRLDELGELAERGTPASMSAVGSTLESFTGQAGEAADVMLAAYDESGDRALIADLRSFTSEGMDRLSALESSLPDAAGPSLVAAGARLADIDRRTNEACAACGAAVTSIPPNLLSGGVPTSGVATVIVTASQDPGLLTPVTEGPGAKPTSPASPDPVSGQDVTEVEVPDLTVPDPTQTPLPTPLPTQSPSPSPTGPGTGLPGVKVGGKSPVNDVTKLLTGDLSDATTGLPTTDEVLTGVGTTLDGTVDGLPSTLDGATGSVLP